MTDPSKASFRLGKPLATGGEGTVYECTSDPSSVAKIYHVCDSDTQKNRESKLRAMIALKNLQKHSRLAWPQTLLANAKKKVIGFTMRKVEGTTLVPLTALALKERDLPGWTDRHLVRVIHDIATVCRSLEANRVYIGDISLTNFITRKADAMTSLIDCDSYQLSSDGERYSCKVYTPDFQAPEVLAQASRLGNIGPEQFRFSAALLFFSLFTSGGHPYQIMDGHSPSENILAGRHFLGGKGVASGFTSRAIYDRYRSLPPRIAALFKRAFIQGHSANIAARPSFEEWSATTRGYYENLSRIA